MITVNLLRFEYISGTVEGFTRAVLLNSHGDYLGSRANSPHPPCAPTAQQGCCLAHDPVSSTWRFRPRSWILKGRRWPPLKPVLWFFPTDIYLLLCLPVNQTGVWMQLSEYVSPLGIFQLSPFCGLMTRMVQGEDQAVTMMLSAQMGSALSSQGCLTPTLSLPSLICKMNSSPISNQSWKITIGTPTHEEIYSLTQGPNLRVTDWYS